MIGMRLYFCTPFGKPLFEVFSSGINGDLVAQLVEHNTFNVGALGSSPSGITLKPTSIVGFPLVARVSAD